MISVRTNVKAQWSLFTYTVAENNFKNNSTFGEENIYVCACCYQ